MSALFSRCGPACARVSGQLQTSRRFQPLSRALHRRSRSESRLDFPTRKCVLIRWEAPLSFLRPSTSFVFLHTSSVLREVVEVKGPAFAESITEGDIRWLKKAGDQVNEDEIVAEIETDKTSVEVPAPHSGVLEELLVADGEKVVAKQPLYKLRTGEGAAPKKEEEEAPKKEEPAAAQPSPPKEEAKPAPTTPPPIPPPPSAPMMEQKVADIPLPPSPTPQPPPIAVPAGVPAEKAITGARSETRVKMNRMRQRIAQRLKDAQNTYALLTTFNEIDMSNLIEMRRKFGEAFVKKHGVKLGFMSPFVKAAAYALKDQPVVNAVIDEQEIIYRHFVDVSVAVATPRGLVVPVLRNVESMNCAQIEMELADMGLKARDNKLAIEDMEGGTFTISNGGVFGSLFGTPIINPPQSAILGMHVTLDRPMAVNGKVEIRPMMTVALTYDHRLVDGREAVTFLKKIKSAVEDPRSILLDL